MEIATQTVNLTSILTNLNSSVTNYNNTSDICIEQNVLPSQINSNPSNDDEQNNDTVLIANQSLNSKNNNGHCITDGIPCNSNNATDMGDNVHDSEAIQSIKISDTVDDTSKVDANIVDDRNTEITVKCDGNALPTDTSELTAIGKTHTETDSMVAMDETDSANRHPPTENINGPTNDFCV